MDKQNDNLQKKKKHVKQIMHITNNIYVRIF